MNLSLKTPVENDAIHDFVQFVLALNTDSPTVSDTRFKNAFEMHRGVRNLPSRDEYYSFYTDDDDVELERLEKRLCVEILEHAGKQLPPTEFLFTQLFGQKRVIYYNETEIIAIVSIDNYVPARTEYISLSIAGDPAFTELLLALFKDEFKDSSHRVHTTFISNDKIWDKRDRFFLTERGEVPGINYPYLPVTPQDMSEQYIASSQNVLVMIGPPGTGKSTYLRDMITSIFQDYDRRKAEDDSVQRPIVYLFTDEAVLMHRDLLSFLSKKTGKRRDCYFVFEDADKLISRRSDGNPFMAGLLNLADGVLKSRNKILVSTNLPSVDKIDEALIRPGRCFGIIRYAKLTLEQANAVRANIGKEPIAEYKGMLSLAEALNFDVNMPNATPVFGFRD